MGRQSRLCQWGRVPAPEIDLPNAPQNAIKTGGMTRCARC